MDQIKSLRKDAMQIAAEAIQRMLPDEAVKRALEQFPRDIPGRLLVIAIGKAAWRMAQTASEHLGNRVSGGLVITKYGHSMGDIPGFEILEAGHPTPDENSERAALRAITLVSGLRPEDQVVLLLSGGGSSLFEQPLPGVSLEEIKDITRQLLGSGADITEMNCVRKHLSGVKGGRFAEQCAPASIFSIVLSDVLGDSLDVIASGPAFPDASTSKEASKIIDQYQISISDGARKALMQETPKQLKRCTSIVTGNVSLLCEAAVEAAARLGYHPTILTTALNWEAREAGRFLAGAAREMRTSQPGNYALILGGETVVHLSGSGLGGRNQELALTAALYMEALEDAVILSIGSDGTDGPTDAAGGIVDGGTAERIRLATGRDPQEFLTDNDSHHALDASGDLILTGPTGTNVNDLMLVLCHV